MSRIEVGDVELHVEDRGAGDPALVLVHGYTGSSLGETDFLRPAADVLAAGIAGAELVVFAGCGHSPQEDDPAAWQAAVEAHLSRAT